MGLRDWLLNKTIATQNQVMPSCDAYIGKILSDMRKNIVWYEKKHGQRPSAEELSEVYTKSKTFMNGANHYGFNYKDITNFAKDALKEA
jgi:hypothetical protein